MTSGRVRPGLAYRAIERVLARVLGSETASGYAYRHGWSGRLAIDRCKINLPPNGSSARSLRIAFASDFHAGPATHQDLIEAACRTLNEFEPDVLLLGGDFVSPDTRHLDRLCQELAKIEAPYGRFAVIGNHDIWAGCESIIHGLKRAGIQVLVNENRRLEAPFENVSVCGLDEPQYGDPNAQSMYFGARENRIVLMHSPEGLPFIESAQFDLAFCGHTHGGQIARKNGFALWLPAGKLNRKYSAGHFGVGCDGRSHLIVSRGVGCADIPVRINAHPNVVLCTMNWTYDLTTESPTTERPDSNLDEYNASQGEG